MVHSVSTGAKFVGTTVPTVSYDAVLPATYRHKPLVDVYALCCIQVVCKAIKELENQEKRELNIQM